MKNSQKGFALIPLVIILALLIIGGGTYIVLQNKVAQKDDSRAQNIPVTTDNNQNTVVNPSNNQSVFVGTKKTFLPEKIVSIDTSRKTFVVNYESRQTPFTIPTEFSVISETTIKKENNILNFSNLAVNDVVWIRAYEKGQDKYVAKNIIITNDWRSSQVIIKKIETSQHKITAEVFLPPQRRREQTILTIIPETEIRKGEAKERQNRKIVGLNNLAVGDIAGIIEVGFGVHPADDKGSFYTTEIDVVGPYYCEQYLKPTGCIEKDQGQSSSLVPTMSKYTDADFGFSFWYPSSWRVAVGHYGVELYDSQGRDTDLGITKNTPTNGKLLLPGYACGPAEGCVDLTYYFDATTHTWMEQRGTQTPIPTNVSTNTMGGLHMLNGNIRFGLGTVIPLSAHNFLMVDASPGGLGGGEHNFQDYLAKTIVATDPSVATPVSLVEQTATIQAEATKYGN